MKKLNIGVIYGGMSPEHEVSRASANTIISALNSDKYNVIPIYINKFGLWTMFDNYKRCMKNNEWEQNGTPVCLNTDASHPGLLKFVRDKSKLIMFDIIFPILHGVNCEDGNIQGLLELSNLPYVGCGVTTSVLGFDKKFTRIIANSLHIEQTKYLIINEYEFESYKKEIIKSINKKIGYPCFIKPCSGGSSIGMKKIDDKEKIIDAIEYVFKYDKKIMVEKAIVGREFECGVLGSTSLGDVSVSGVGELKYNEDFYSYDAKYFDNSSFTVIPAEIPREVTDKIKDYSKKIFQAIDGEGLSRVDFFLEEDTNKVLFNEINTMPGFNKISMYPKLWEYEGINLELLVDKLIEFGLKKYEYQVQKNKL